MMNGTANNFTTPKNITTFILKNKTKEFLIYARYYNYITPINTNNFIIDNKQRSFNNTIEKLKPVFNTDKVNLELLILEQDLKIKKLEELKLRKDLEVEFNKNITINLQYPNSAVARIHNHLAYN